MSSVSLHLPLALAVLLPLAACTSEHAPASHAEDATVEAVPNPGTQQATVMPLRLISPWTRSLPPGAPVAAGFLTIRNTGHRDERLLEARTDLAERTEIHEVVPDEEGVMRMRQLEAGLAVEGQGEAVLRPGGHHLMFFGPQVDAWQAGSRIPVTLVFEHGGEVEVELEVVAPGEEPSGADDDAHDDHHGH